MNRKLNASEKQDMQIIIKESRATGVLCAAKLLDLLPANSTLAQASEYLVRIADKMHANSKR